MEANLKAPELPVDAHLVNTPDSPHFSLLRLSLSDSTLVALDAEWKPHRRSDPSPAFPTVTLLQIACRCRSDPDVRVFVVDLLSVPLIALWEILQEMFVSPAIVKLGFRFKQDLKYLSSTFASQGCASGFDRVEPFLDITSLYHFIKTNQSLKKLPKEMKGLSTICKEILGVSLAKEFQCSDWSCRPLTKEQIAYAAADAYYLIELFEVFHRQANIKDISLSEATECYSSNGNLGLKDIFQKSSFMSSSCNNVVHVFCEATTMVKSSNPEILSVNQHVATCRSSLRLDASLSKIVERHGDRILLKESDKRPKTSKRKGRKQCLIGPKHQDQAGVSGDWVGPPPWDPSLGGDGYPKFLCDVMVEGLAKHLRCVGIDAAIPSSRKPEPRGLLTQAQKERRVLLTRDTKLLKHQYIIENQVYRVKSLLKNEQLLEVIEIFQLKISEDQLMSRCTKCNGRFIQKPLTIKEAIEASKGFQVIPDCLFKQDLEFWQCMDCNQLYWEGTQYHNAVEKFVNVCKLKELVL